MSTQRNSLATEYGPIVSLDRLREAIRAEGESRFHPRMRLALQQFVLLTSNNNIDFLCELIKITGENHELSGNQER